MKEALCKSLHIVWFYLYDISEKSKTVEAENRSVVERLGKWEHRSCTRKFLGQSFYKVIDTWLYVFVKTHTQKARTAQRMTLLHANFKSSSGRWGAHNIMQSVKILWNFVKIELVLQMYDIMSLKGVGENRAGPSNFGKQYFAWKCKMKTQRAEHKHCSVIDKFVSHGNIV